MCLQTWDGTQPPDQPKLDPKDHMTYMRMALDQARESPPKPSNFCVGAIIVDEETGDVLTRGYTLELEGNTHAEQCALTKYAETQGLSPTDYFKAQFPSHTAIYTTMEPCNFRLSGNLPCVDRIIETRDVSGKQGIKTVYLGVKEPEKFVGENKGIKKLEENGIKCIHIPGLEEDILRVATAGHEK